jgi:hypothetical protein
LRRPLNPVIHAQAVVDLPSATYHRAEARPGLPGRRPISLLATGNLASPDARSATVLVQDCRRRSAGSDELSGGALPRCPIPCSTNGNVGGHLGGRAQGHAHDRLPVSFPPSKERRYRITDSYLRFWLAFLGPHLAEVDRMRSGLTLARIERSWADSRGRAVEPLVREALARLLPAQGIPAAPVIGGYWTRSNDVEIDIVALTGNPSRSNCCSSARSSGWRQASCVSAPTVRALRRG